MSVRAGRRLDTNIVYEFWLSLTATGEVSLTLKSPALAPGARAMKIAATLPGALFRTPQIAATITVAKPDATPIAIDLSVAEHAMRTALGCDVTLRVVNDGSDDAVT